MFQGERSASDNNPTLLLVAFAAGVKTDRGVAIGSTVRQLRQAYGQRLRRRPRGFWVVGTTGQPRYAISFSTIGTDKVVQIVWGYKQPVERFSFTDPPFYDARC